MPVKRKEFVGLILGAFLLFGGKVASLDSDEVEARLRLGEVSGRGASGSLLWGRGPKPVTGWFAIIMRVVVNT